MSGWVLRIEDTETMTSVSVGPYPTRPEALGQLKKLHHLVQPKAFIEPIVAPLSVSAAVASFLKSAGITGAFDE